MFSCRGRLTNIRCTKLNSEVDAIIEIINDDILIVNDMCKHKNGIREQKKKKAHKQKKKKPADMQKVSQLIKQNVGEFAKFSMLSELKY